jgi:hypothetical protein
MCIRDRLALISLVVLASVTTPSAAPDIHGSPSVQDSRPAAQQPRAVARPADAADISRENISRETKTLAVILLMLKDGRGAR